MKRRLQAFLGSCLLAASLGTQAGPTCLTSTLLIVEPVGNYCPPNSHAISNGQGVPYTATFPY